MTDNQKFLRTILTANSGYIDLYSDDQKIRDHFDSRQNYADFIIEQFHTKLYNYYFENKKDLTVLDIGANVGLFAYHISDSAKKIVCVEPTPDHLHVLKELAKQFPQITVVEAALSDQNKITPFYLDDQNTTMNSLVNDWQANQDPIFVKGKTLKTILDENNLDTVDFCKIDIEGSEMRVLTPETINGTNFRIKNWYIEVHYTKDDNLFQNRRSLIRLFRECGYIAEASKGDEIHVWLEEK